jgi:hypothetical protein
MENEFQLSYEGDYVKVVSNGEKNFPFVKKLWTAASAFCREKDCYRVLGLANTTVPINYAEAFEILDLFQQLGLREPYRIAWVELNPSAYDSVDLAELVLRLRGYPARLFSDVETARQWLLESNPR